MKKKVIILATAIFAIAYACTSETANTTATPEPVTLASTKWQETPLTQDFFKHQKSLSHYSFNTADLQTILSTENIHKFKFELGLKNNKLQITAIGVDAKGNVLGKSIADEQTTENTYKKSINNLAKNTYQYTLARKSKAVVGKHLLSYKSTYSYITKWQNALKEENIENLISYNGERIRYFSLEKEVIAEMVAKKGANKVALFLGLNANNKLTTVFMLKNNNTLQLKKSSVEEGGYVYDFTTPCPHVCDDESPDGF